MNSHTLILSTAKVTIPDGVTIDFVTKLINRGLTAIDYFGAEIDNQPDYLDEEMKVLSETISYFHFNFDTEEAIDYDSLSEIEVDNMLMDTIKKSANIELQSDHKDITVYL